MAVAAEAERGGEFGHVWGRHVVEIVSRYVSEGGWDDELFRFG